MMEQSDKHKQFQHSSRDPGHEGFQSASLAFMPDPASSRNANIRLLNLNAPKIKPVLNYSIQTGEEFALEFMRDGLNPKKPLMPNTVGNPNYAAGYMELKGILGISHTGSEGGSDISMLTMVEKGPKEFERTNASLQEERSNYGSVQSVPRTSSGYESRVIHGYASSGASDSSSAKMKVLCSFGGKILPRPCDGKLRYVGGETRIMRITKDISWCELRRKIVAIYNQTHVIKYQLPGEDLDALVSVSCDEDLLNMMDEWNEVEDGEGSQKLRLFLFSTSDLDDAQFSLGSVEGDSESQFVAAVNGISMDMGSRKSVTVHGLANSSRTNLDELDRSNIDSETSRVATVSVGVSTSPLPSAFQSAQSILQSSSTAYETYPWLYHGQMMDHRETKQFPLHYPHDSSSYSPFGEIPYSTPFHGLMHQQGGLNERQLYSGLQSNSSQMLVVEVKPKPDGSNKQEINPEKIHPLEKVYPVPVDEVPVAVAVSERDLHSLPSKNEGKLQEPENASSAVDAVNSVHVPKSSEDDQCSTSSSMFGQAFADAVSNPIDLSYLEPPVPQRVYYSERIPREQAELLNRLSKSDDSLGSQLLIAHSRADIAEQNPMIESAEKMHESNLALHAEHSKSTAKPLRTDHQTIDDGLAKLKMYKDFADAVSQMNKNLSDSEDVLECGLKQLVPKDADDKDATNKDRVLNADSKTDFTTGNHKKLRAEERGEAGPGYPAVSQATAVIHHNDPASNCPEPKWDEMTGNDFTNNNLGHSEPFSWTESSTKDASQGIPPVVVSATKQADILIDIDDRFPRDFLSEMFSRGIFTEDTSDISPIHKDGTGVSVNMEDHEPKRWSYFQKFAREEFLQKDVSLIDQDHLGIPSALTKVEDHRSYHFTPLATDGDSMGQEYSQLKYGEDIQDNLPGMIGAESTIISDFDHSQVKESESMQFDAMMENQKSPESQYKVFFLNGNLI